jgi:hypothetical protein
MYLIVYAPTDNNLPPTFFLKECNNRGVAQTQVNGLDFINENILHPNTHKQIIINIIPVKEPVLFQ